MAGARAATSLSFTIGIALATLVVGGGILAGPSVIDCSRQPDSFGACLRSKVIAGGVLPAEPSLPSLVSSEPPRLAGWIEANATEYEAPLPDLVQLSAEPGRLDAAGALPGTPEISAKIALAHPSVSLRADGLAPLPRRSGDASLGPVITGSIDATGDAGVPRNGLSATTSVAAPALTAPPPASGRIGGTAHGQGRASLAPQLIADLSPVPPLSEMVPAPVPQGLPPLMPRPLAAPSAAAQLEPKSVARPRPPKYDPRYPNVLVLPPPNTGENSSFATLELR